MKNTIFGSFLETVPSHFPCFDHGTVVGRTDGRMTDIDDSKRRIYAAALIYANIGA